MTPTPFQRLFTDGRPIYFMMAAGAAAMVAWAGSILLPAVAWSPWNVMLVVVFLPIAACMGAVLGVFPGMLVFGFVLEWVGRRNGAPFHVGDEVVILSKRFPGRVSRIYAVWEERREVRVELDEKAREDVTDVFSVVDVRRLRPAGG